MVVKAGEGKKEEREREVWRIGIFILEYWNAIVTKYVKRLVL